MFIFPVFNVICLLRFDQKKHCDDDMISTMIRDFRHFDYMFISVALGTVSSKVRLEIKPSLYGVLT